MFNKIKYPLEFYIIIILIKIYLLNNININKKYN